MGNRASIIREEDLTTVVIIGITGAGKSTLCNALAGTQFSSVAEGFTSGTEKSLHYDVVQEGVQLRVVDTVGFLSNRARSGSNEEETILGWWPRPNGDKKGRSCAKDDKFEELTPVSIFGVDAFVFVERFGRFTEESARHFRSFVDLVGPEALKHTIYCFTHISNDGLTEALEEEKLPLNLMAIQQQVHSMIGVESVTACRQAVSDLMREVKETVKANDSRRYTSDDLRKIQEKRRDLVLRIGEVRRADRRELLNRMRLELMNGQRTYPELLRAIEEAEAAQGRERPATCLQGVGVHACAWRWPWPR